MEYATCLCLGGAPGGVVAGLTSCEFGLVLSLAVIDFTNPSPNLYAFVALVFKYEVSEVLKIEFSLFFRPFIACLG